MLAPCLPIAKLAATALARPARHALHHVVRRVVRHAHTKPAITVASRPTPAVQCLQKPGVLPAGPGAAAPALRSAAALRGAGTTQLSTGAAGAGLVTAGVGAASANGGAGLLAAVAAAAGLAVGGILLASITPSTPSPNTAPLARTVNDVPDTIWMSQLAEANPGFASPGLPMNLTLPDQPRSPADTGIPGVEPNARPAGPATPKLGPAVFDEAAPVNVPEPSSIALLGLGGLGALLTRQWRWRRPMLAL